MCSNRRVCPRPLRRLCVITLVVACLGAGATGEDHEATRARALELYDAGRYEEARPLLEQLDAAGPIDGTLLYRLYYCQRLANDEQARATLDRARQQLEQEVAEASDLEAPFYLANTYRNVGRLSDAQNVAAAATARVESGDLSQPTTGVELFRLAKLYADQERAEEATRWFTKAVELLASNDSAVARPYIEWAGRYLADQAWTQKDYDGAAKHLAAVTADKGGSEQDLNRLATAYCRTGRYGEAKSAWQQAERSNPAHANHARYSWRLAAQAEQLGSLPDATPDGRSWDELSQEELEQVMLENAQAARAAVAEVEQAEELTNKQRQQLQLRMDEARPVFIAAALEYALRGYQIRETAFANGYAPMIFHAREWKLPQN
jgi:tetratricopeptide (TPR) repeat protein